MKTFDCHYLDEYDNVGIIRIESMSAAQAMEEATARTGCEVFLSCPA